MVSLGTGLSVRMGTSVFRIVRRNHPFSTAPLPKSTHPSPRHPAGEEGDVPSSVEHQPQDEGPHVDQGRGYSDARVVPFVAHAPSSRSTPLDHPTYSPERVEGVFCEVLRVDGVLGSPHKEFQISLD